MITLLGAAPNTGNQGVSALCYSAVAGLAERGQTGIAVADHGRGLRPTEWNIGGARIPVTLMGLTNHRRLWRGDCLRTVGTAIRFGGMGNEAATRILNSDAVLDVSGGDSYTDLYGEKRFRAMVRNKRLALDAGVPLILLPQTLGPFRDAIKKAEAVDILSRAAAVWVRDRKSFDFLRSELGDRFDPARHCLGVDMAVLLPKTEPQTALPAQIAGWLQDPKTEVAGINVSGLLCFNEKQAQADFGLKDSHVAQLRAAAEALLHQEPAMKLLLVPHVLRPEGDPESDYDACKALENWLSPTFPDRVATVPQSYNATELKWVLSQLDWFAGARMHATIGAFSSGVPTLGLGYSDKAAGVFAECGIGDHVADLRQMDAAGIADAVANSVAARADSRAHLDQTLPDVFDRARAQMDGIAAAIPTTKAPGKDG